MMLWVVIAAVAQAATPAPLEAPSPQPMIVASVADNVLHVGTAIQLEMRENLTTQGKKLKVGQRFEMGVLQPVMLNGRLAIPAGSRAVGEVVAVRNKGMWGKSGSITCRVLYLEANGRQLRLNGTFDDRGETGTVGVIASVALVPVAGFFVTGTSANIVQGAHVTAFLAEEVPVEFSGEPAALPTPPMIAPSMPGGASAAAPTPNPAPTQPVAGVSLTPTAASNVDQQDSVDGHLDAGRQQ